MKKIALFTALIALAFAANAQSLNVQSAMTDMKRGYISKAKTAIDKACAHEDTKDQAKTWYYAGLIYSQIGEHSKNPKSKYKDLDPDWRNKTYEAALRCKELDKNGEYKQSLKDVFRYVGNDIYNESTDAFNNKHDYNLALSLADQAIKVFNNAGDDDYANSSYYLAGYACYALNDTVGVKKYFTPLIRRGKVSDDFKSTMVRVFNIMFGVYKEASDTANVLKTAERYTKMFPNDANAHLLLASAYIWTGNTNKGLELTNKAVEESKGSVGYPIFLCAAAGNYEQAGDFATAEAKYKESSELNPNQVEANYGMAGMAYNRAVERVKAINEIINSGDFSEEADAAINKMTQESKEFFAQAIPYLKAAINYIDGLPDAEKEMKRKNLYDCLTTLNTCYLRLEMDEESIPIQARIKEIESKAK